MDIDEVINSALEHHGVKGMKWGIRRNDAQLARVGSVAPTVVGARPSGDAARVNSLHTKATTKGTGSLDNKELQDLVNRMNLEQQFSRLSSQPQTVSKGHTFARIAIKRLGPSLLVTGLAAMAKKSGDPKAMMAAKALGLALNAKSLAPDQQKPKQDGGS